jgi:hypothetical protein
MAAVPAPWPVGRQSSNAAKASDIQESEAVLPLRLEGGTLCLFLPKSSIKGERLSESSEILNIQASEMARPPRLERGTLLRTDQPGLNQLLHIGVFHG